MVLVSRMALKHNKIHIKHYKTIYHIKPAFALEVMVFIPKRFGSKPWGPSAWGANFAWHIDVQGWLQRSDEVAAIGPGLPAAASAKQRISRWRKLKEEYGSMGFANDQHLGPKVSDNKNEAKMKIKMNQEHSRTSEHQTICCCLKVQKIEEKRDP